MLDVLSDSESGDGGAVRQTRLVNGRYTQSKTVKRQKFGLVCVQWTGVHKRFQTNNEEEEIT